MDFGDPDCVAEFLRKMCFREGIGDVWAEGVLRVEKEIPELKGVAVHCKGMEPAGYEPRVMKGMGLGFATTSRGACHLRATMYKPELMGSSTRARGEDKAAVYCDWEDRLTIMDCLVYCRFYRDLVQWPYITQVVNAAIGTDYTEDDLHRIANRIVTMTHDFNAKRGIGRESEVLPEWVTDKPMEDETRLRLPAVGARGDARRLLPHPRLGRAAGAGVASPGGPRRAGQDERRRRGGSPRRPAPPPSRLYLPKYSLHPAVRRLSAVCQASTDDLQTPQAHLQASRGSRRSSSARRPRLGRVLGRDGGLVGELGR